MKNIFLFLFLIGTSVLPSLAQQELSLGVKVGYASAGLNRSEYGKKSVDKPLVGAVVNFSFTELFSLQLEGNYMQKGGGYGFKYNGDEYFDYFKFRVVEIPLLATFTIGETRAKFIGFLGPYVGYTLNLERKYEDPDAGIKEDTEYDNYSFHDEDGVKPNRFDGGIVVGIGFTVDIGSGKMFMETRYATGFGKWFDLNPLTIDNYGLKDLSHRVISISAGYRIPVWSKN